jgi:hypothetical protein
MHGIIVNSGVRGRGWGCALILSSRSDCTQYSREDLRMGLLDPPLAGSLRKEVSPDLTTLDDDPVLW